MKHKRSKIFLVLLLYPVVLLANNGETTQKLNWFLIITTLLGGLALFLYGMEQMSESLKRSAGNRLRKILASLSKNRFIGLLVGAFVTMIIQSSSATTVMLVSFVNAGLMDFGRTLGIILGANIGTTITAQIIAFKITDYAIIIITIGFLLMSISKKQYIKELGNTLIGFGLLFYGMELMSDAMKPLRTYPPLIDMLKNLRNPLIGVLTGMIMTAIIQSSSAFTGIIIILAQQHLVGLQEGITLILGANIGTCITAALASIKGNRAARRVAIAHITFKTLGVIFFIFWIPKYAEIVKFVSSFMNADAGREIANAHTIFNVINAFIFLPFTGKIAEIITKIYPDKKVASEFEPQIRHLDENVLHHPSIAIDLARAEIGNLIKLNIRMLQDVLKPFFEKSMPYDRTYKNMTIPQAMKIREKKVDFLEKRITEYLLKITANQLDQKLSNEVFALITTTNYLESIADVVIDDILPLIEKKQQLNVDFSDEGKNELKAYHTNLIKQLSRLYEYFSTRDIETAKKIMQKWEKYKKLDIQYRISHYQRMHKNPHSIATHRLHMELMDHFEQIGFYINSIANALLKLEQ